MFAVGALYLVFEKSILVESKGSKDQLSAPSVDVLSRIILGSQVCCVIYQGCLILTNTLQIGLVGLAMFVTRSSVWYIQAREGLPNGTKFVGWFTLGEIAFCSQGVLQTNLKQWLRSSCPSSTVFNPTTITFTDWLSSSYSLHPRSSSSPSPTRDSSTLHSAYVYSAGCGWSTTSTSAAARKIRLFLRQETRSRRPLRLLQTGSRQKATTGRSL